MKHKTYNRVIALVVSLLTAFQPVVASAATQYVYRIPAPGMVGPSLTPGTGPGSGTGASSKAPAVQVDQLSLAFPDTSVGATNQESVNVTNSGTAPLTLSAVQVNGAGFSLGANSCSTIGAGASCAIPVNFKPTASGLTSGGLSFQTNAATGSMSVYVFGRGVMSPETLTSVTPSWIGTAGGAITIAGSNFTNTTSVTVDGADASVTARSQSAIAFTAPAHAAGNANVVVTTEGSSASATLTYVDSLTGTSFTPASVPGGQASTVTLTGTGFSSGMSLSLVDIQGNVPLTVFPTVLSGTQLSYVIPASLSGSIYRASLNDTYARSSVTTGSITVTSPNTLGNWTITDHVVGDVPFVLIAPTSNSGGAFSYTSSNTAVATISGNTVTIVGAGTTTITANQSASGTVGAGSTTTTLKVSSGTSALTGFSVPTKLQGDPTFTLTPPTSASNGTFTYTSSDVSVATISGNTVTIVGPGSSTITANQAATSNYAAGSTTAALTVSGIVITSLDRTWVPSTGSTITMLGSGLTGATIMMDGVPIGTTPISDTKLTFNVPAHAPGSAALQVARGTATVSAGNLTYLNDLTVNGVISPASVLTATPTTLALTGSGLTTGMVVTFIPATGGSVTGTNVIASDSTHLTVTAPSFNTAGLVGIQVSDTYGRSAVSSGSLVVNQTPTINTWAVPSHNFGEATFSLTNPVSNSTGAFSYTSSNTTVATVSGNTVTIVGSGTTVITANQAASGYFVAGSTTATLNIGVNSNTLTGFNVPAKVVGDAAFSITPPTSGSNGAFTYSSSNTAVATISGSTVTLVGAGTSTITVNQAASGSYAAGNTTATLTVSGFSFTSIDQSWAPAAGRTVTMTGSGFSSGVTVTVGGTAVSTTVVSDSQLTFAAPAHSVGAVALQVGHGTAAVSAGNLTYLADLAVGSTISPSNTTINTPTTLALTGSGFSAGMVVTFIPASGSPVVGTNALASDSAHLTVTAPGFTSNGVVGVQVSDTYGRSTVSSGSLVVNQAPTINVWTVPSHNYGNAAFSLTNPVSNSTGAFSYTSSNTAVATVSGNTVTIVGSGTTVITANQAASGYFVAGSTNATLNVGVETNSPSGFTVPSKYIGDSTFNLAPPTSSSAGAFTYTSSNLAVATILGSTVTIVGAGTTTITANQAAAGNYAAGVATASLTVTGISFTSVDQAWAPASGRTATITGSGFSSGVTVTVAGTLVSTTVVSNTQLTFVAPAHSAGTVALQLVHGTAAVSAGNLTYLTDLSVSSTISPISVLAGTPTTLALTGSGFSTGMVVTFIPATGSPVTGTNVVASDSANLTVTAPGFSAAGLVGIQVSDTYGRSAVSSGSLVVNQTPTISAWTVPAHNYGDTAFALNAPASNSNGAFTYSSSNQAVATVSGSTVTIVGSGTAIITANQAASGYFVAGSTTASLVVNTSTPTLGAFTIPTLIVGDTVVLTPPTSNSSGTWTYSGNNPTVATVNSNGTVVINAAGSVSITAVQSASGSFVQTSTTSSSTAAALSVTSISQTFMTASTGGVITINGTNFPTNVVVTLGGVSVPLTRNSSALLTVSLPVAAVNTYTILVKYGNASVTAGNIFYLANLTVTGFSPSAVSPTARGAVTILGTAFTGTMSAKFGTTTTLSVMNATSTSFGLSSINTLPSGGTSTVVVTDSYGRTASGIITVLTTPTLGAFTPPNGMTTASPDTVLTAPTSDSAGTWTYTSGNTAVATIVNGKVHPVAAGSANITATQAATGAYDGVTVVSSISIVPVATDPNFSSVTMLMHLDNNLTDSAKSNAFTGTAPFSSATPKFGAYATFDGSTTSINATSATVNSSFGTGDFTIEFWMNPSSVGSITWGDLSNATILDNNASQDTGTGWWAIHQIAGGKLQLASNSVVILTTPAVLTANTWQHVALVRASGILRVYVQGVAQLAVSYGGTMGSTRALYIGKQAGQNRYFKGGLDDIRITKGVAVYTANFGVPTAAFPNM